MTELLNKKILFALLMALVLGTLIGWLAKPAGDHQENAELPVTSHQHDEASDEVWTCSMHPQIRQTAPGQCPICGMDLIPASTGADASGDPMVYEMTPEAVAMAQVHTSRVRGVSPEGEVFLTGKVEADERQLASVTAKFPGRIEQLHVNFTGETIQKGEKLATLYSPELVTAQQELLEAAATQETYPELYLAAREKLRRWKLTEKQVNAIEKSGTTKDRFEVLTDKEGVVTRRNVAVGDYVGTGSVLFEVVDLSKVWIMIDAYETDLPFIETGDEMTFTAAGIPGETFTARVTYIDPVIDPDTRTASVRAETTNENEALKPGMFVTAIVRTTLSQEQSSLAVPRTAVLWSGKRSVVYVKVANTDLPAYEMREITLGPRMGDIYLVEGGLELGEEIVTNGVFAVDAAAQLSGNYSMMMRPESTTMDVPPPFRQQITAVAEAYFAVKNALVADSAAATQATLDQMQDAVDKVAMHNLREQPHHHWMVLKNLLEKAIKRMQGAEDLKSQREHFATLSEHILEMTELFGLERGKVYKNFCPMAFDNQGAYWLSEYQEIRNPYFGSKMLTCGSVQETIL